MRLNAYLVAATLALTTGLCIAGDSERHDERQRLEIDGLAEPLLGLRYDGQGLEFQLQSSGCTEKTDFAMQRLSPDNHSTTQLLLIRLKPDFCDAFVPFGIRIFYRYEELGLEEGEMFTVLNPLSDYRVIHTD